MSRSFSFLLGNDGGGAGAVDSVFGRTGDVVAVTNDYTWAQIDKTVSSIVDINSRSHTDLQDIGVYTHPEIDSHIDDLNNPHQTTAAQVGAVALTGDETVAGIKTFSSIPVLPASNPTTDNQAVRKLYVDTLVTTGARFVAALNAATTTVLPAVTYANGASGVGATLTANANGAFPTIDGVAAVLNNTYLIKDQASGLENGAYQLTTLGDGGTPFVFTRITTYDLAAEIVTGTFFNILAGTVHANQQWALTTTGTITVGTTALVFSQLSSPVTYTASNGILLSSLDFQIDFAATNPSLEIADGGLRARVDGTTVTRTASGLAVGVITDSNISGAIEENHGGTGLTAIGSANEVLGVNNGATGLEYKAIVGGSNVTITHSTEQIEISAALSGSTSEIIIPAVFYADPGVAFTFTNVAAALTTATTNMRLKVDLTGAVQFRFVVNQSIAGFAGTKFRMQYSTNNTTFFDLANTATAGDLDVGTGTGVKVGAWADVAVGAKQDVWLQLFTLDGDGVVDPAFREIKLDVSYNSSIVDGSTASVVNTEICIHAHPTSNAVWTNMPAALTEFPGNAFSRVKADLTGCTHYRLVVNQQVAGFAGADLNLEYSLNNSTFQAADTASAGELDVGTGTGVKVGAWAPLVDAAKQDVWLRLVGKQGDGIVDPGWREIRIQLMGQIFAPAAGSDTEVIFNSGGVPTGDSAFTFNSTTDVMSVPVVEITNATQNYQLSSLGGTLSFQARDSGEQSAFGIFSRDGDGTDNAYQVFYGVGLPGNTTNSEALLVGYIASGTAFQIAASAEGTGTVRPIILYTEGNFPQFTIAIDGSVEFNGLVEAKAFSGDQVIFKSTTATNSSYVVAGTPTGNGTENTGFAVLSTGTSITAANTKSLKMTFDEPVAGANCVVSVGAGSEQALDLVFGVSDTPASLTSHVVMDRTGNLDFGTAAFHSNSVDNNSAFGVFDPTDVDLPGLGIEVRPLLTLWGVPATNGGDGVIGIPLRYESNEDEPSGGNIILATATGGTRASPTIVSTAQEVVQYGTACFDGTDFLYTGGLGWIVTGTPATGDVKTISQWFNADGEGVTLDENANIALQGQINSYNGVATAGAGVASIVAVANLTAQSAAITPTTLYAVPASGTGFYRVSWVATVTTAATISSSLGGTAGFQLVYTDADDAVVKTSNPTTPTISAGNTTATSISGTFNAYCDPSTNLQYSFGYTSSGATAMQYNLHISVEYLG